MSDGIALTPRALDQLKQLALRAHDGSVYVTETRENNGLDWIRVDVLLTDMGDEPPLHTFYMTPTGTLRRPSGAAPAQSDSSPPLTETEASG